MSECEICTTSIPPGSRRYGGHCCNPCASFFYRSVKIEKKFKCNTGTNDCLEKPSINGKGCQKCRYAKCLEIGMSTPELFAKKVLEEKKDLEERTLFSQIASSFITDALKFPALFVSYIKEENQQFLTMSLKPFENYNVIPNPFHPLTYLILMHPFTQDEFPTFCHFILCQLEFKYLGEPEKAEMKKLQNTCLERVCSRVKHKNRLPVLQNLSMHFLNIYYALNNI